MRRRAVRKNKELEKLKAEFDDLLRTVYKPGLSNKRIVRRMRAEMERRNKKKPAS
jgi:hypothetical protein